MFLRDMQGLRSTNCQVQNRCGGGHVEQYRKWGSQRTYMHDPWTRTKGEAAGGKGGTGLRRLKGKNQNNYKNIVNKIYVKKERN